LTTSFKTSYVKFSKDINIIGIFTLKNVEFRAKKEHLQEVLIHYVILKKSAAESYLVYFGKLMVNKLHLKIFVNVGLKVVISM